MPADFHFPAQPAEPAQEYTSPPVARETEYDVPPVNAGNPAIDDEFDVSPARDPLPAYHRGPSYASEVDNLAEPQVFREDTILVSQRPSLTSRFGVPFYIRSSTIALWTCSTRFMTNSPHSTLLYI